MTNETVTVTLTRDEARLAAQAVAQARLRAERDAQEWAGWAATDRDEDAHELGAILAKLKAADATARAWSPIVPASTRQWTPVAR